MRIRTLFSGLLLFSGQISSSIRTESIHKSSVATEMDPLQSSVSPPVLVTPELTERQCTENQKVKAKKQKAFSEEFELDDMVIASGKLKRNNPVLAKIAVTTVKEILMDLLLNN